MHSDKRVSGQIVQIKFLVLFGVLGVDYFRAGEGWGVGAL